MQNGVLSVPVDILKERINDHQAVTVAEFGTPKFFQVVTARIALGGLATKPWRSREAEQAITGQDLSEETAAEAAEAALAGAAARGDASFKIELGRRTLVRALLEAQAMEVAP